MKTYLLPCVIALLCSLTTAPTLPAADKVDSARPAQPSETKTLKVGDKAPALIPGKWLQGGPITIEPGKCYMLEFWATWCGPCVAAIPHLEELHKKYKDKGLTVIGVNAGETDQKAVQAFLDKRKKAMTYAVAFPGADYQKTTNWLEMAGENGIPCSFLIAKDGTIAAITHPMYINDEIIDMLLADKPIAKTLADAQEKKNEQYKKLGKLSQQMYGAKEKKDWKTFEQLLGQIEKEFPENKMNNEVSRLELAVGKNDANSAMETIRKLVQDNAGSAPYLVEIATQGSVPYSKENVKELKSLTQKAVDEIKAEHADNTYALLMGSSALSRVLFLEGNVDEAIATLDAIKAKTPAEEKQGFNQVRDMMKKSFQDGNMPEGIFQLFRKIPREKAKSDSPAVVEGKPMGG